MNKNVPNILTVFRVILVPFFVLFYLTPAVPGAFGKYLPLAIFIAASITDFLDGAIARHYGFLTNFGRFMDPLADKILVGAALICFVQTGRMAAWAVIILISREFVISGFRMLAAVSGRVISAGIWGKLKTAVQMVTIILILLDLPFAWFGILCQVMVYLCVALSLISLAVYFKGNLDVLQEKK